MKIIERKLEESSELYQYLYANYPKVFDMVGNVGSAVDFNVEGAMVFCLELLQDVNYHKEMRELENLFESLGYYLDFELDEDYPGTQKLVQKVNKEMRFDGYGAMSFCLALLEDVNAHSEMAEAEKILMKSFK